MPAERFVVYGGTGNHSFDQDVLSLTNAVSGLGLKFGHISHSRWPDGEAGFKLEKPGKIAGRHVVVFSCPITDKLELQLRDIVIACKQQYLAASVTVVISFLRYRRQDHSDKPEEITRLRWFLRELRHWGADRLIVCEPHNVAQTQHFCDEFGLQLSVTNPTRLFTAKIADIIRVWGQDKIAVYSPDLGSVGRAMDLASSISAPVVATPKRRINDRLEEVDGSEFLELVVQMFGDKVSVSCDLSVLSGTHVFMREDELSSGRTAVTRAVRLRQNGAASVRLVVTHPVCSPGWKIALFPDGEDQPFEGIWFGNTRPRGIDETDYEGSTDGRVTTVNMAPAMAETLIQVLEGIKD